MSVQITGVFKNVPDSFSKRLADVMEKSGVEGSFEFINDGIVICLKEKEPKTKGAKSRASVSQGVRFTRDYMETFHISARKITRASIFSVVIPVPAGIEPSDEKYAPIRDRASLIQYCVKEALKPSP